MEFKRVLELLASCDSVGRELRKGHDEWDADLGTELTQIAGDAQIYQQLLNNKLRYSSSDSAILGAERQFAEASANTIAPLQLALSLQYTSELGKNPTFLSNVLAIQQKIKQLQPYLPNYRSPFNQSSGADPVVDALVRLNDSRANLARSFKSLKYAIEVNLKQEPYTSHIDLIESYFSNNPPSGNVVFDLITLHLEAPFTMGGPQLSPDTMPQNAVSLGEIENGEHFRQIMDVMWAQGRAWAAEVGTESNLREQFVYLAHAFWSTILEQLRPIAPPGDESFEKLETFLRRVVAPSKPMCTVAIFGVVNAGKTTLLNAIIGQEVLPSSPTAWPCCIQHEKGLKEPRLTYDQAPFMHALRTIRERKIGRVMDSNWERNMWNLLPNSTQNNDKLYNDRSRWVLPKKADGREAIHKLLSDISDICRVCIRFELPSEVVSALKWPTISVEFSSLPDNNSVDFKFIDVPDYGEDLNHTSIQPIINKVLEEFNAIVVVHSQDIDIELPVGIVGKVDLVVCTYLDDLSATNSELEEQMRGIVSSEYEIDRDRVVFCSALLDLGVQILLKKTTEQVKPSINFEDEKFDIEIKVIKACCGNEENFDGLTAHQFLRYLKKTRDDSKIPQVLNEFEKILLENDCRKFYDFVTEITLDQNNSAELAFDATHSFYQNIQAEKIYLQDALATWSKKQPDLTNKYGNQLEVALSSRSTYNSVASLALSDVRDRWVNNNYIKIKYNSDDEKVLQLTDDAEDEDLDEQFERFKQELGTSLQKRCNEKLLSIVRSESLKAGKALIADIRVQLRGSLSRDAIKIEDDLENRLKSWINPNGLNKSGMSINVSGEMKDYGGLRVSDFALPALASLAYFPIGAIFLGGRTLLRLLKDSKLKLKEHEILSSLQEVVAKMERNSRQQYRKYVIGIMDAVARARKEEVEYLEKQLQSYHSTADPIPANRLRTMLVISANLSSTRAAAESLLDMVNTHSGS